jgi:hypothetical protein
MRNRFQNLENSVREHRLLEWLGRAIGGVGDMNDFKDGNLF